MFYGRASVVVRYSGIGIAGKCYCRETGCGLEGGWGDFKRKREEEETLEVRRRGEKPRQEEEGWLP